jgi:glutamate synthase (NADPH/NADH) small chain
MGRKLVVQPDLFQGPPLRTQWRDTLEEKCRCVIRRYRAGQRLADKLRELAAQTVDSTRDLDETLKRAIVVRLYDCMRWGGMDYARRYAKGLTDTHAKDSAERNYAATEAVVFNLADAMLIKDGVFLAELATSPEKYARDREKYNVNPANGDRIRYRHFWRWRMRIGSRTLNCRMTTYDWMLGILKRSAWLRKALPGWHETEKLYLQLYERRIAEFTYDSAAQYAQRLKGLASAECFDCVNPNCQELGCPVSAQVPKWVQLAYRGHWQEACDKLHEVNNFPEFTSRICPAPCQGACKQSLRGYPVEIRLVEREIIDRAFEAGYVRPQMAVNRTQKRVAIIGSGPAGLTCAQQLSRSGHDVVIFEKDPRLGGMLRYGVPDFRLDKQLIDRRIEQLAQEGISFRTGLEVGKDAPADKLLGEFDAVCLAVGARRPKDLDVPGRRQEGVHYAMDLLEQENRRRAGEKIEPEKEIHAAGKVVVVIGGGETGSDCVDTLCLQGAKAVHQFEILPPPAQYQADQAEQIEHQTVVHRRWNIKTLAFGNENGRMSHLSAVSVRWVNSPTLPQMQEIPGSQFTLKADMAILAVGFEPALSAELVEQLGLETDVNGRPVVRDHRTSVRGVFATGDLVTGPSRVISAIDSGRKAAAEIERYLARTAADRKAAAAAV